MSVREKGVSWQGLDKPPPMLLGWAPTSSPLSLPHFPADTVVLFANTFLLALSVFKK